MPLLLCTTGPDLDGLHSMLRSKVAPAHQKLVRVLSSFTDEDKVWLYHHCAAFVLPSKPAAHVAEAFGIVLVEKALSEGSGPTLATRTGYVGGVFGKGGCLLD